jgi:hypothetical protein
MFGLCSRGQLPAKCAGLDVDHYYAFKTVQANQATINPIEPGRKRIQKQRFSLTRAKTTAMWLFRIWVAGQPSFIQPILK